MPSRPTLPTPGTSTWHRCPLLPVTLLLCPLSICSTVPTSMTLAVRTSATRPASTATPKSCFQPRQPPLTSLTLCGGPGLSDRHFHSDFIQAHRLPEMPTDCKYVQYRYFHDILIFLLLSKDLHGHCVFFFSLIFFFRVEL